MRGIYNVKEVRRSVLKSGKRISLPGKLFNVKTIMRKLVVEQVGESNSTNTNIKSTKTDQDSTIMNKSHDPAQRSGTLNQFGKRNAFVQFNINIDKPDGSLMDLIQRIASGT